MGKEARRVTLRRSVQQVKHCVEEALSVIENKEDLSCALDDLRQAAQLIEHCLSEAQKLQRLSAGTDA